MVHLSAAHDTGADQSVGWIAAFSACLAALFFRQFKRAGPRSGGSIASISEIIWNHSPCRHHAAKWSCSQTSAFRPASMVRITRSGSWWLVWSCLRRASASFADPILTGPVSPSTDEVDRHGPAHRRGL